MIDYQGSGSEGVRNTFERARELCLALDEVKQLPRVYDGLVLNYHFTHSQPQKIVQYTREILEVCERTNDPQALLMARRAGALANLLLGRFAAAREDMQRIVDMYELDRDGPHAGMSTRDPKVSTCTLLGICLTILGFPDTGAADQHGRRRACEDAEPPDQPQSRTAARLRARHAGRGTP